MSQIQFATDVSPGGALMSDDSARATSVSYATNVHGFAELRSSVPMVLTEAFGRFDRAGLPHQRLNDGAGTVYEGRLEDLAINGDGVASTALGYSRSLSDVPYTALWSAVDVSVWRPLNGTDVTGGTPDRFAFDTQNRLYIAPQKNSSQSAGNIGAIGFQIPDGSSRNIIGVSFDWIVIGPLNWEARLRRGNSTFGTLSDVWTLPANGGTQVGSTFLTFTGCQSLQFFFFFNAGAAVFAGETGSALLLITNMRAVTSTANKVDTTITVAQLAGANVTSTVGSTARMYVGQRLHIGVPAAAGETVVVEQILNSTQFVADFTAGAGVGVNVQAHVIYADEIVRDIVAAVNAVNPTQLSSSTALIQSPALDLLSESYQDQYGADILTRLIGLGDSQATPRQWEWAVWENRALVFQPRGATARTWYVDLARPDIERSLNALANSVYADYQDASGRTLRTAVTSDTASIARYGVTRRTMLPVSSTSTTQVAAQQAAQLLDTKDPTPRARVTIEAVFDQNGTRWPLTAVRANDTIVIRNLPPTLGTTIDRVRILRAIRTELDLFSGVLTIEPESPLPSLTALLARAAAPAWVATPWWVLVNQK